jgi:hypothetical protein
LISLANSSETKTKCGKGFVGYLIPSFGVSRSLYNDIAAVDIINPKLRKFRWRLSSSALILAKARATCTVKVGNRTHEVWQFV